jgi:hypothetical protein
MNVLVPPVWERIRGSQREDRIDLLTTRIAEVRSLKILHGGCWRLLAFRFCLLENLACAATPS